MKSLNIYEVLCNQVYLRFLEAPSAGGLVDQVTQMRRDEGNPGPAPRDRTAVAQPEDTVQSGWGAGRNHFSIFTLTLN